MAEKVEEVDVDKESGYLYFVDKEGDVSRVEMARGGGDHDDKDHEKVARADVDKESGYLYFVDTQGDISRAEMARGRD